MYSALLNFLSAFMHDPTHQRAKHIYILNLHIYVPTYYISLLKREQHTATISTTYLFNKLDI